MVRVLAYILCNIYSPPIRVGALFNHYDPEQHKPSSRYRKLGPTVYIREMDVGGEELTVSKFGLCLSQDLSHKSLELFGSVTSVLIMCMYSLVYVHVYCLMTVLAIMVTSTSNVPPPRQRRTVPTPLLGNCRGWIVNT